METISLDDINMGEIAYIADIYLDGGIQARLRDFGFSRGAKIKLCGRSIMNDPKAFLIKGAVVAIRRKDCQRITARRGEA